MLVRAKRQVFASDKHKVTLAKEKKRVDRKTEEKERKREEAMVPLLVFKLATLKKLLDGSKMYMYVHVVRDKFGALTSQKEILFRLQMLFGYTFLSYVLN